MRPGRDFRFQKTDFKPAGPNPTVGRFQISDPRAEQADVASPLQISDTRMQTPRKPPQDAGVSEISVPDFRIQNSDAIHQEVSVRGS